MIIDITTAKRNPNECFAFDFNFLPDNSLLCNELADFNNQANIKGSYYYNNGNVYVKGVISYSIKYPCDRCLKEVLYKDDIEFNEVFYKQSDSSDDYIYNNDSLDLTKAASDYIMLNIPSSIICSENCKGLCPNCGKNLNEGQCSCKTEFDVKNPFSQLKNH